MTKITFRNGQTPAINDTNLNQMQTNIENAINNQAPVVLYNNSNGTTGTVTLSETSANFRMLEIFYSKGSIVYQSVKVFSPNGKTVSLIAGYINDTSDAQILIPRATIRGTSITRDNGGLINFTNHFELVMNNEISIYAVVGYR